MFIYKITNIVNGKVYIGKTETSVSRRWKRHLRAVKNRINRYLYDAINHYGIDKFIIETIDETETKEELNLLEKHYIAEYKSNDGKYGYNMTSGGDGGSMPIKCIEKAKITRLKNNNGVWQTSAAKEKQKDGMIEYYLEHPTKAPMSEEQKIKLSVALKSKWETDPEYKNAVISRNRINVKTGSNHHFFGKHHTKEAREKISLAGKGRPTSAKQKRIATERWVGEYNPNFKEVDINTIIKSLLDNISLQCIANNVNMTLQGLIYKIKTLLRIKNIKEMRDLIKNDKFLDYLHDIGIEYIS